MSIHSNPQVVDDRTVVEISNQIDTSGQIADADRSDREITVAQLIDIRRRIIDIERQISSVRIVLDDIDGIDAVPPTASPIASIEPAESIIR